MSDDGVVPMGYDVTLFEALRQSELCLLLVHQVGRLTSH